VIWYLLRNAYLGTFIAQNSGMLFDLGKASKQPPEYGREFVPDILFFNFEYRQVVGRIAHVD